MKKDLSINIMSSTGAVECIGCSSCVDGKCLESPEKLCDCCASEFEIVHC